MRSSALLVLVLLATAIVFVPAVADTSGVVVTYNQEKQLSAMVGKPTEFIRSGMMQNTGALADSVDALAETSETINEISDANIKIKFDSKARIKSVVLGTMFDEETRTIVDGVEYTASVKDIIKFKKHSVKIHVAAGATVYFQIHYLMPAPTMTSSILQNTVTNFLSQFSVSTNYEQHTSNVVAPLATPELPGDWTYEAFVTGADGIKKQARYYLKDSDGSGALDEIGVVVPQLSEVGGELGGQPLPSPSKLSNYKFQQVRADNAGLPFGWFFRVSVDAVNEDQYPWGDGPSPHETIWPYFPFSDEGYDDSSSLIVRAVGEPWILSEPVEVAKSIDIAFKYKPQFGLYGDTWPVFVEMLFLDGTGDTTYQFRLKSDGSVESDEFVVSSTPDVNGWYSITALKTLDLPEGESRLMRLSVTLGAYGGSPGEEIWLDNMVLNTV